MPSDAGCDLLNLAVVGEICGDEFFVGTEVGRLSYVADADPRIDPFQQPAQSGPYVSSSAGNQNGLHQSLVHSPKEMCCRLLRTVLARELLVALAAVEEMVLHGLARLRSRAALDRLEYLLVLLLERVKLDAARSRGRAIPD